MNEPAQPITCHELTVGYDGEAVLGGVSFAVDSGSTMAIVGRSGCGKTTLLKTLAGILEPLDGRATVLGRKLPATPPAGDLGYIPQGLGLVEHESVLQNVLHGRLPDIGPLGSLLGRFPPEAKMAAREAISRVGLAGKEETLVKKLSGGQRRRVAIARAFVQEPRVLLADEMLSELDPETTESIVGCLSKLQAKTGMTVVMVEHNRRVAEELAGRVLSVDGEGFETREAAGSEGIP